jgi:hypothetical protein
MLIASENLSVSPLTDGHDHRTAAPPPAPSLAGGGCDLAERALGMRVMANLPDGSVEMTSGRRVLMGAETAEEPVHGPVRTYITLAVRIEDLQRTLNALLTGHPQTPATVTAVSARRLEAEIEMLLICDDELARILRAYQGQPAVAASISPASRSEGARSPERDVGARAHRRGARTHEDGVLTAHQTLAIRRAYPEARVDGPVIRVGRWTMILLGERLDLPITKGLLAGTSMAATRR